MFEDHREQLERIVYKKHIQRKSMSIRNYNKQKQVKNKDLGEIIMNSVVKNITTENVPIIDKKEPGGGFFSP